MLKAWVENRTLRNRILTSGLRCGEGEKKVNWWEWRYDFLVFCLSYYFISFSLVFWYGTSNKCGVGVFSYWVLQGTMSAIWSAAQKSKWQRVSIKINQKHHFWWPFFSGAGVPLQLSKLILEGKDEFFYDRKSVSAFLTWINQCTV